MRPATFLLLLFADWIGAQTAPKDACLECHMAMDSDGKGPASLIKGDIHFINGLSCADCHGGDRSNDDMAGAMNPAKGFIGAPKRTAIPQFCARCHSNPEFMRKYRPQQRVDQFELYQTSIHGKRLASGDANVATCIDCHSVHDIRAVKDARSPVNPLHVPETCGRCHADSQKMAKYKIPVNQLEEYRSSVHAEALMKRGDISAPTCASCHGNHGAKPPEVQSVAAVCGSCHVLFAQLFEKSVHMAVFTSPAGGGCTVCHNNHAIHQPSTAMLAGPQAVCSSCHDPSSAGAQVATQMRAWIDGLDTALKRSEAVLASAERYGMEVSDAQVRLLDGRESLVKARLAVHSFDLAEVKKPIDSGMAIAEEALRSGQQALHEKDVRRIGLAVSAFFIAITIAAIWFLIRNIESREAAPPAAK